MTTLEDDHAELENYPLANWQPVKIITKCRCYALKRKVYVGAFLRQCLHAGVRGLRVGRLVRFWVSGGAKLTKMGYSLPSTPMNRRAKYDATSCILGGEIRNRTNTPKKTQTHKHTNKQ